MAKPINALLNLADPSHCDPRHCDVEHRFQHNDFALLCSPQAEHQKSSRQGKTSSKPVNKTASFRSGTSPISIPGSMRRKWRAISKPWMPIASRSRPIFKGKLARGTANEDGGNGSRQPCDAYEAIDDLAGRLGSYAGLVHPETALIPQFQSFTAMCPSD